MPKNHTIAKATVVAGAKTKGVFRKMGAVIGYAGSSLKHRIDTGVNKQWEDPKVQAHVITKAEKKIARIKKNNAKKLERRQRWDPDYNGKPVDPPNNEAV